MYPKGGLKIVSGKRYLYRVRYSDEDVARRTNVKRDYLTLTSAKRYVIKHWEHETIFSPRLIIEAWMSDDLEYTLYWRGIIKRFEKIYAKNNAERFIEGI